MNERGEASSQFIIALVLVIASFAIIVFFLTQQIYGEAGQIVDREACHNSVVLRATAPDIFQSNVPLQCVSDNVCITSERGGECEQFNEGRGVRRVRLDINDIEEAKNTIERESADAMFSCWSMMGEGKLDLFGRVSSFNEQAPKCVVCTRIAFAEDLTESVEGQEILKEVNVDRYMAEHLVPGSSLTYLQTLTDRSVNSYAGLDVSNGGFGETEQVAFIFGQIKTPKDFLEAGTEAGFGAGIIAGGVLMTGPGKVFRSLTGIWGILGGVLVSTGAGATAAVQTWENQQTSAAFCGEFTSSADKRQGCSIVQAIKWDADNINSLCEGGIEGDI